MRYITISLLFLSFPAFAGFEEGRAAYDRKDWRGAITHLRPLAEAGDDRAMVIIGNMYAEGHGVVHNDKEALSLYKRAATEKNNADAMVAVASFYLNGMGVPRNFKTALEWYQRAAERGNQIGAFFYATMMLRGNKSVTKDVGKDDIGDVGNNDIKPDFYIAYKWFLIAAKETEYPKLQTAAAAFAKNIADQKLTPALVAKARKEAAAWKP